MNKELPTSLCEWSPEIYVDIASELAWPVVVLLLGYRFRNALLCGIKDFFTKNSIKEFSASATGLSAKFQSTNQEKRSAAINADKLEPVSFANKIDSGEVLSKERLQVIQEENATLYSQQLLKSINSHLTSLKVTTEEKVELLAKEVSINQAAMIFLDISLTLFQSQYKLFNEHLYRNVEINISNSEEYFKTQVQKNGLLQDWSAEKYYAFPLEIGLLEKVKDHYRLTDFGKSYVRFMRNNPKVEKYLAAI